MRRFSIVLMVAVLMLSGFAGSGQSYYTLTEIGFSGGGSQYFGDLNEHYGFKTIAPAYGLYIRRKLNSYIAIKAVGNYTKVSYDDKYNTTIPYDIERNLSFSSPVLEFCGQAEFNFFKFITGDPVYRFTPYLTGGLGFFYYNPSAMYKGTKYDLLPLGTEGQNVGYNRKYSNFSACVPIGVGVKYWLKAGVNLTLEVADRLTTTDYLDDVSSTYVGAGSFPTSPHAAPALQLQDRSGEIVGNSTLGTPGKQRGNASSFDQYLMVELSLSFHFTTYRCPQHLDEGMIRTY